MTLFLVLTMMCALPTDILEIESVNLIVHAYETFCNAYPGPTVYSVIVAILIGLDFLLITPMYIIKVWQGVYKKKNKVKNKEMWRRCWERPAVA